MLLGVWKAMILLELLAAVMLRGVAKCVEIVLTSFGSRIKRRRSCGSRGHERDKRSSGKQVGLHSTLASNSKPPYQDKLGASKPSSYSGRIP